MDLGCLYIEWIYYQITLDFSPISTSSRLLWIMLSTEPKKMCYGNFLGGLSTTAIILIIVGCVVGVALIGGVLFVLLKPKKKGKGTKICTTQSI